MSIKHLAWVALVLGGLGCDSANDPGGSSLSSAQSQTAGAGGANTGGLEAGGSGGSVAPGSGGGPDAGGAGEASGGHPVEQGGAGAGVGGASTEEGVSFSKDVVPIFEKSCAKCHHTDSYIHPALGPQSEMSASQLREVLLTLTNSWNDPLVVPGSPDTSFLLGKLTGEMSAFACANHGEGACGKQMPPDSVGSPTSSALDQQQLELIRDWISQGAKDN